MKQVEPTYKYCTNIAFKLVRELKETQHFLWNMNHIEDIGRKTRDTVTNRLKIGG